MAIFGKLFKNVSILSKGPGAVANTSESGFNFGRPDVTVEDKEAIYPQWFFSSRLGQPRQVDTIKIRKLAQSSWVQMVLNTFKKQLSTIEWRIVPKDEDDGKDYTEQIKKVEDFLKNIIPTEDYCIEDLNSELVTDIGEIDGAVVNYVYSSDSYILAEEPTYNLSGQQTGTETVLQLKPIGQRTLVKMRTVDGASVLKEIDIHKNLIRYWQYSFKHPRQNPTPFSPEEMSYLMMNNKSYSVYGFSPVQSIQQVLELLIQGTRYNKDMFKNNAIPDLLVSLPKVPTPELKKLKRAWNNQFKGRPHPIGFVNWAIENVHKLASNNRDLEWLEGQKWYFKIVFGVFGVSSTEAGFFENANKSNDEGQSRVTVRNALKPMMSKLERLHTNRTIVEILQDENNGLEFKYFPKDHVQEEKEFEQNMKKIENDVMTINEFRNMEGKDPVEWGDKPTEKPSMFGSNPMNNPSNEIDDKNKTITYTKAFEVFLDRRNSNR